MHDILQDGNNRPERIRSSSLFSIWRLIGVLCLAFTVSLLDMFYFHIIGIDTVAEVVSQTIIHTIGLYGGLTLSTLFISRR